MTMLEVYQNDGKVPILIRIEYDEEDKMYIIEVERGYSKLREEFEPKHEPKDKLMNIADLEHSVKIANALLKKMKQKRRKK